MLRAVLRKIPDFYARAESQIAGKIAVFAGENAEQRGLSRAVPSRHHKAVSAFQRQVKAAEHIVRAVVGLSDSVQTQRDLSRMRRGRKLEMNLFQRFGNLNPDHFVKLLLPLLRLRRFCGLVAEAVYEILQMTDFLLLLLVGGDKRFQLRLPHFLIVRKIARIAPERPAEQLVDFGDGHVQKIAVVAYEQKAALIAAEELLQIRARLQIQIIGRLVEQENVRLLHERLRKRNPHLPAAGEFLRAALKIALQKPQPRQNRLLVGASPVPAAFVKLRDQGGLPFQKLLRVGRIRFQHIAEPVDFVLQVIAELKREVGLFQKRAAVMGQPRLRNVRNPAALLRGAAAAVRLDLTGHNLHERGFSRAVRAGERGL